jgi:hypothetical protein
MSFFDEVTESLREWTERPQAATYKAGGKTIQCTHCDMQIFTRHKVVMRGPLSWALVCAHCSAVRWFADEPTVVK